MKKILSLFVFLFSFSLHMVASYGVHQKRASDNDMSNSCGAQEIAAFMAANKNESQDSTAGSPTSVTVSYLDSNPFCPVSPVRKQFTKASRRTLDCPVSPVSPLAAVDGAQPSWLAIQLSGHCGVPSPQSSPRNTPEPTK